MSRADPGRGTRESWMCEPPGVQRQRADAHVLLAVTSVGGTSRVARMVETGSARIRLPRSDGPSVEAVTINTGGGIAAGDRFATDVEVGPGAELTVTTAAAEKIYRSDDRETAEIRTTLSVAEGGRLDWLPQETILFDRARLRRSLSVELGAGASVLLVEAVAFGRAAFGEIVTAGLFQDRWRVRRNGRVVYADTLRFEGPIASMLGRPASANGGRALATLLYAADDAESRLEEVRDALSGSVSECGASAWNGMLAARFLAAEIEPLRRDVARLITALRGRPMPRMWSL